MRFLLDSNILSEPTRHVPDPKVISRLREHHSESVTAATVTHEMRRGDLRLATQRGARRELVRAAEWTKNQGINAGVTRCARNGTRQT